MVLRLGTDCYMILEKEAGDDQTHTESTPISSEARRRKTGQRRRRDKKQQLYSPAEMHREQGGKASILTFRSSDLDRYHRP